MFKKRNYLFYYYLHREDGGVIRLKQKSRPTKNRLPYDGCFIVNGEWSTKEQKWLRPCFPQITSLHLFNRCQFLGSQTIKEV